MPLTAPGRPLSGRLTMPLSVLWFSLAVGLVALPLHPREHVQDAEGGYVSRQPRTVTQPDQTLVQVEPRREHFAQRWFPQLLRAQDSGDY